VTVRLLGEAASVKFDATDVFMVSEIVVPSVRLPETPVIVTVVVPVAAVALAVSVRTLEFVAGFVPNAAVTPVGRPDVESVTPPLKPFDGVIPIVVVPWDPRVIVRLLGEATRVKLDATDAFTVSEIVVPSLRLPETPVIVTFVVPAVAVALAASVRTLEFVAGFVPNDAVTPVGRPDADSVTPPVKPFDGVMVIVFVPPAPCVIVTLFDAAERPKLGEGEPDDGHAFTRFAAFNVPIPVAKSQPAVVP
jgi:hypothetical protein